VDTKVCKKCQKTCAVIDFYKGQSQCKPCAKEYARAWAKANPEKYKKQWQKQNKKRWVEQKQDQTYMTKKAIYRQENSARRVATAKAWNQANRERFTLHVANSHIKRKIAKDARAYKILDKEYKRLYNSPCAFCGATEKITMDHIIPISRSGNHSIGNLQPLCRRCNSSKKSRLVSEYKYYLSKLKAVNQG
jgi:5-methylcytosine-specific restriction endonuclease McrA